MVFCALGLVDAILPRGPDRSPSAMNELTPWLIIGSLLITAVLLFRRYLRGRRDTRFANA